MACAFNRSDCFVFFCETNRTPFFNSNSNYCPAFVTCSNLPIILCLTCLRLNNQMACMNLVVMFKKKKVTLVSSPPRNWDINSSNLFPSRSWRRLVSRGLGNKMRRSLLPRKSPLWSPPMTTRCRHSLYSTERCIDVSTQMCTNNEIFTYPRGAQGRFCACVCVGMS